LNRFDFPQSTSLLKLAADIYENSGAIAAVCHGPVALTELKLSNGEYLVKGKLVTGFTNEEEDYVGLTNVVPFLLEDRLKERGGNFIGVGKFECNVQQSERLITGQNPQSSKVTAERMVSLLLLENQ
jgi:putative intracellular protease/amidase